MIAELKAKLLKTLKDLDAEINQLGEVPEMGTDIDHFDTETDEAEEYSTNLGIKQSLKERRENVRQALSDMEIGAYGKCVNCKKEIDIKILKVNPEARYCKSCKQ